MTRRTCRARSETRRWLLAAACAALTACGGGGGGDDDDGGPGTGQPVACSETAKKQWVLDVAREWYLFPETLPASVNLGAYRTAEELLDAITANARAQGKDRYFSYLTTRAAEQSLLGEGQFVGFGFRTRTDPGNRPFILDVFEGSPAAHAGLRRGDEIVAVDSGSGYVAVSQLLVDGRTISDVLGPATEGIERGLRVRRDGSTFDVRLVKVTVTMDPVPDSFGTNVLPLAGTTGVGYVHLRSYISPADPQLREAFAGFRQQNLNYYIVDLRYNGGGLVSIAELLDNLLAGGLSSSDVQYRIVHSQARSSQNSTVRFQPTSQSVQPVRIAFLTTQATASASEINVNSLKPHVEVAIVGSNTYGKPVGQYAFDLSGCPDRLRLVTFRTVNSLGEGDYYGGLAATVPYACAAPDNVDATMGTSADRMVTEALAWLGSGRCNVTMFAPPPDASAKPATDPTVPYPRPLAPSDAERWLPGVN